MSIIFIVIGTTMVIKPIIIYNITERWKTIRNAEPSKHYIYSTRFGGIIFILIAIMSFVVYFIE